ncbi:putative short chain dehydrogenase reductase [Rosellinia necatrix]|uniref:Putative short chain dehydrogenase reductase n=1 Tax=Rosellinia necatrix TaxID=77044 RepID=A0A1W2THZ2_ROSNE|nr:putative short chain dehydrogenase reductase [Rosellinia necatrix]
MDAASIFRVDGMVAVVTGGGTGIGLHMAKALANAGASKVYILARRRELLDEAAKAHESLRPIACDVGSKESLQAAVDVVARESGHVNLVVANSGVIGPAGRYHPDLTVSELRRRLFDDVSMDDFTQAMHVNVTGAYFTMLAFLELLDAGNKNALRGGFGAPLTPDGGVPSVQSQVLFTSSISAYSRAWLSLPAYAGSKSAIAHLAKHASTNLSPYGIRANVMAPGLFPSDVGQGLIQGRDPAKEDPSELRFIPARRFGGEEEMAGTVLYLASRAGAYCNGLVLVNDGGSLATMPSEY